MESRNQSLLRYTKLKIAKHQKKNGGEDVDGELSYLMMVEDTIERNVILEAAVAFRGFGEMPEVEPAKALPTLKDMVGVCKAPDDTIPERAQVARALLNEAEDRYETDDYISTSDAIEATLKEREEADDKR